MRVICVKQESYKRCSGEVIKNPYLIVGNEYHVIQTVEHAEYGVYYLLEGGSLFEVFHSSLFAIISNIDELDMVNQKELDEA